SLLDIKTSEEQIKEAEAIIPDEDVKMVVAEATTVKLYPNPAQFDVYLQFSDPKLKISNISVYDFNGRFLKFFDKFQIIEKGKGEYRFNISGMSDGVYILKIFTENFDVFTLRLIKKD
ncbi:T9SS type A sorting domain-containing protein, partial [Salegentibacter salinarum]